MSDTNPEREAIVAIGKLLLDHLDNAARPSFAGTAIGDEVPVDAEAVMAVRTAIARFTAQRLFVCREHRAQFSSSTPCPGCTGPKPAAFLVDGVGETHLVHDNGRVQCGKHVSGSRVTHLGTDARICADCHAQAPSMIWHKELPG